MQYSIHTINTDLTQFVAELRRFVDTCNLHLSSQFSLATYPPLLLRRLAPQGGDVTAQLPDDFREAGQFVLHTHQQEPAQHHREPEILNYTSTFFFSLRNLIRPNPGLFR